MRSCEWEPIWHRLKERKSPYSKHFYASEIRKNDLIKTIANGSLFGIIQVSVEAPESVKKDWRKINFAPIFQKRLITADKLSTEMQKFFELNKTKVKPQLTQGFSAEKIILSSEYLAFLLECGFICTEIDWCLEYQRGFFSNKKCFLVIFRSWDEKIYRKNNC